MPQQEPTSRFRRWVSWPTTVSLVEHPARTALASVASLLLARALGLQEAYWAAITTLIVFHSNLGAALTISGQRMAGTALGASVGALLATYLGPRAMVFGVGVFAMGLLCAILRLDRAAYRFAGITLAIIMLTTRFSAPMIFAIPFCGGGTGNRSWTGDNCAVAGTSRIDRDKSGNSELT